MIKDVFTSNESSILDTFLESSFGKTLVTNVSSIEDMKSSVQNLFEEGKFNETWNTTLNQFDAFVANLSLYLSCFEFNKFVGMASEYELEELGIQLVDRKQLWAGIVFKNMPAVQTTDDLPKFIQYKIRDELPLR